MDKLVRVVKLLWAQVLSKALVVCEAVSSSFIYRLSPAGETFQHYPFQYHAGITNYVSFFVSLCVCRYVIKILTSWYCWSHGN